GLHGCGQRLFAHDDAHTTNFIRVGIGRVLVGGAHPSPATELGYGFTSWQDGGIGWVAAKRPLFGVTLYVGHVAGPNVVGNDAGIDQQYYHDRPYDRSFADIFCSLPNLSAYGRYAVLYGP